MTTEFSTATEVGTYGSAWWTFFRMRVKTILDHSKFRNAHSKLDMSLKYILSFTNSRLTYRTEALSVV